MPPVTDGHLPIKIHRFTPTDPRLGRHVEHDPRSRDYAVEARSLGSLRSVRHRSHIGILDQGHLGSCTGNAATKCISFPGFWRKSKPVLSSDLAADEQLAIGVYSDATKIDGAPGVYPPTDTGSSGLAVAKVLQSRGLISSYQHAFSLEAALTAIASRPVIVGIAWHQDMFQPDSRGFVRPTGGIAGGHEFCVDQISVSGRYVGFSNSWGESWGIKGRARITWDDFGTLLADQGDVTVLLP